MVARFENPLVMVGRFGGSLGNTVLKLKGLEDPWVIYAHLDVDLASFPPRTPSC